MSEPKVIQLGKNTRRSYSKIDEVLEMPNLIDVQKTSYKWFIDEGIKEVFRDTGAIEDHTGTLALEFVDYHMEEQTKYSVKECKERDVTYAAPLKVTIRLLNKETGEIKQQEIILSQDRLFLFNLEHQLNRKNKHIKNLNNKINILEERNEKLRDNLTTSKNNNIFKCRISIHFTIFFFYF